MNKRVGCRVAVFFSSARFHLCKDLTNKVLEGKIWDRYSKIWDRYSKNSPIGSNKRTLILNFLIINT